MKEQKSNKEGKYTSQGWKRTLTAISNYAPKRYERKADYDKKYPLVKKAKVKPRELRLILDFLEKQGLIEYDNSESNWINLTSRGVDVALQSHSAASTDRTNRISLFLSFAIALFVVTSLLMGIDNPFDRWGVAVVLGGALIYAAYLFGKMR